MKIVHVSHLYYPSMGGVQFFFKNVSERLVKDYGDDVTVVTTNSYYGPERKIFKKIEPAEEVINGVKVIRFSYRRWHLKPYRLLFKILAKLSIQPPESMSLQLNGPYSKSMKKYLMEVKADAFCGSSSNYWFMQLPLWRKCRFFYFGSIHLHGNRRKDSLFRRQVASMNASTLYLANTQFEIARLADLGVQREKIFVLGVGVDMEPFLQVDRTAVQHFKGAVGVPPDGLLIGYVGRIEPTKNVLLAIQAFNNVAVKLSNVYLLIAGSGDSYVNELKAHCAGLPKEVGDRIKWKENFTADEKALIFNSIDILVLPSHNESFGLVFLEAWSCKKPVIGAATGAIRDVISNRVDGLLMEINDEQSLAEKLTELINDKGARQRMGENGFVKVKENYTWDIIVARLRQCYANTHDERKSISKNAKYTTNV